MNWIKITPETELPLNVPVLVWATLGVSIKGVFGKTIDGFYFQAEFIQWIADNEITHFAIITNPEQ